MDTLCNVAPAGCPGTLGLSGMPLPLHEGDMGQLSVEKRGCCGVNLYHKDIYSRGKKKKKAGKLWVCKPYRASKSFPLLCFRQEHRSASLPWLDIHILKHSFRI